MEEENAFQGANPWNEHDGKIHRCQSECESTHEVLKESMNSKESGNSVPYVDDGSEY